MAKLSDKTIVKILFGGLILIVSIPLQLSLTIIVDENLKSARKSLQPAPPRQLVRIPFGKNVLSITGLEDWQKHKDGRYEEYIWLGKDSDVQIDLPGGRQLRYLNSSGDVTQENEIVSRVHIKLLPADSDYLKTVNNLEAELITLSEKSREKCRTKLNEIRDVKLAELSTSEYVGCSYDIEDGVHLRAGVEWTVAEEKRKWLGFLEFSLSKSDKIQACCPNSSTPLTKPSENQSNTH